MSLAVETVTLDIVVPEPPELPDEISLHVGDEKSFLLPSRAAAGYVWEAKADDEAIVEASTKFEPADAAAIGQGRSPRTSG